MINDSVWFEDDEHGLLSYKKIINCMKVIFCILNARNVYSVSKNNIESLLPQCRSVSAFVFLDLF